MEFKNMSLAILILAVVIINTSGLPTSADDSGRAARALYEFTDENQSETWYAKAQGELNLQLQKQIIKKKARNAIMFLGDGMSLPTLAAARIYKGQLNHGKGEEAKLSIENFPYTGLSKTYCVNSQVADSACSATAYLCGVKANIRTIGVTGTVVNRNCTLSANTKYHVDSIAKWAQDAGKSAGIVTTTRVTHASPAGTFAHTAHRDWESDADVLLDKGDPKVCHDIAFQLVNEDPGNKFKVILGGGRQKFLPKNVRDEDGENGEREDGLNLINIWQKNKKKNGSTAAYVTDRNSLLNAPEVDYLMGLFSSGHMPFHLDADAKKIPTLAEMTEVAIKRLSTNKEGYFLFVEGGRIDHGHHANKARKALDETLEFADAITKAQAMVSDDTLIVITSDHAHTMSFSGYPTRGNNILGFAGTAIDQKPYTTLSYANGPSYVSGSRPDLTNVDTHDPDFQFPSTVPIDPETHGGDDVGVFAKGPYSHLFVGVFEESYIPHAMAYAMCIGKQATACSNPILSWLP